LKEFNTFYFEKFSFDQEKLEAKFFYSFDKQEFFEEIIDFSSDSFDVIENINKDISNNFLFNIHIVLWISYYKLFPTKKLIVESGFLTKEQIDFWKKLYRNGLGEFFIKNNIDFKNILEFENSDKSFSLQKEKSIIKLLNKDIKNRNIKKSLLMWGGWKDSIVSSILLEKEWENFSPFVFWKIDRIKEDTLKTLWKKTMLVKRKLSSNLFKLNEEWYFNWHVPITWIIAFVSLFSAYLYNFKDIVLSNEKSADEWNIIWNWLEINHQYSKSWEFERDFRLYVVKYISKDINYYSKLRDKYELEIAEIFSKNAQKYFKTFSSCNRNFVITWKKQNKNWCCECEKCAFVYLILGQYLDESEMLLIFWENLLKKETLFETYKWLFWFWENKPFECVWTYEESIISAKNMIKKYNKAIKNWKIKKLPYILSKFEEKFEEKLEK